MEPVHASAPLRPRRLLCRLAFLLALVLMVTACSKDKSPEERLQEALDRGLVELSAGQYDKATESFNKVLEIDPNNRYGHYNLGVVEMQNNRLVTAEAYFRAAINLDPNLEGALFNLAIIRTPSDPDEAAALYRRCVQFNAANAGCHLNLGFLLKDVLGEKQEGIAEIRIAAELNPAFQGRLPALEEEEKQLEEAESGDRPGSGSRSTGTTEAPGEDGSTATTSP